MHEIKLYQKVQLFIVRQIIKGLNLILTFFKNFLFSSFPAKPLNILIYKIGNIGDIVCAIPSFIAIRRAYPEAKITLLTSPGKIEASGAKELLENAWYVNELKIYYSEDIDSWEEKKKLIVYLRENRYNLFIQLPDDLANFRTLFRNMIFAKIIGVKSAFGFKIRSVRLFEKTQNNYLFSKTEVENLLDILKENGVKVNKAEFDFNIPPNKREVINSLLNRKWIKLGKNEIIAAINPGGKRKANQWPLDRFSQTAKYLQDKHNVKIIIIGGAGDVPKADFIKKTLKEEDVLVAAGELDILGTMGLLERCSFLISNDTGAAHMASAIGLPVVGLYGIRYIPGKWFPYGDQHKILYHKFLDCDYRQEDCVKKSVETITVEEAIEACDSLI
ncbi:MAG: glycosyltransferase family 9 protein, partial [Patescibacteria group bacterium]